MRGSVLIVAALAAAGGGVGWSTGAVADSCVTLEGPVITNRCQTCMKVTVRSLQPAGAPSSTVFAGEARTVQVEAGAQAPSGAARSAITGLEQCR